MAKVQKLLNPKVKDQNLLKWSISDLAKAMKISEQDVKMYFTDGRKVSFIIERRLAYGIVHGKLAPNELQGTT